MDHHWIRSACHYTIILDCIYRSYRRMPKHSVTNCRLFPVTSLLGQFLCASHNPHKHALSAKQKIWNMQWLMCIWCCWTIMTVNWYKKVFHQRNDISATLKKGKTEPIWTLQGVDNAIGFSDAFLVEGVLYWGQKISEVVQIVWNI